MERRPAPSWSRLAIFLVPPLLCLLIYWNGLLAWFQLDDFAWLSLHQEVVDFRTFLSALFQPMAQGTVRPLSERLFFLAGWHVFGMEAFPFRMIVFATMFANLALLTALTRRLTGSDIAAFAAPVLWLCNSNLYAPMSWTSGYNQVLCAFFLLAGSLVWVRYTETGDRRFYWRQWLLFLLGFAVLELHLVYPVLAALHAWCFARPYLWRAAAMFPVSVLFVILHRLSAPPVRDETYRMYFDASMFEGLASFFGWSISAHPYADFRSVAMWPFYTAAVIVGLALAVFSVQRLTRKDWLPLFCIGWFVVTIAPVLPLKSHRSEYYVTIPVIGLAILGAYGLSRAWPSRRTRVIALVAAVAYAVPGAWMVHGMSAFLRQQSTRVKHLLRGVAGAAHEHPGKVLVVAGVDDQLFWRGWYDDPFRALGLQNVFLSESTATHIRPLRGRTADRFVLADTVTLALLSKGSARVYDVLPDGRLQDRTAVTQARLERQALAAPGYLDVRSELSTMHLGSGWWPAEANHRWMSRHATVQVRGPRSAPGRLLLRGFSTREHIEGGQVVLSLRADGVSLPPVHIGKGNPQFEASVPLPAATVGKQVIEIELSVDRPLVLPGDRRELGVAFGTIAVQP